MTRQLVRMGLFAAVLAASVQACAARSDDATLKELRELSARMERETAKVSEAALNAGSAASRAEAAAERAERLAASSDARFQKMLKK